MRTLLLFATIVALAVAKQWELRSYYDRYSGCVAGSTLKLVQLTYQDNCTAASCVYDYEDWEYTTSCLDALPELDSYFTSYDLVTLYDGTDQCQGTPVQYQILGEDICETLDSNSWTYWFSCDQSQPYVQEYYEYHYSGDTPTCTGTGTERRWPYSSASYYVGGCYGYYNTGPWWRITCDAGGSSGIPQWQLVTYYTAFVDDYATTCGTDILGYSYYLTDQCITRACFEGTDLWESWSCQLTEPDPLTLAGTTPYWTVPFFSMNDYTCSGEEPLETYVWLDPVDCHLGDTYYYWFEGDVTTGDLNVEYYSTCRNAYSWSHYSIGPLPLSSYDGLTNNCWFNYYTYTWYVLSQGLMNRAVQTVYYYGTNTSGAVVQVDQWTSYNCLEQDIPNDYYHDVMEHWTCEENATDLMSIMPEGLFAFYYGTDDTGCNKQAFWSTVMTQTCVNDTQGDNSVYYSCYQQTGTTVDVYRYYNCYAGCTYCSSSNIMDDYSAGGANYCYKDSVGSYIYTYFTVHCAPPNPQYQVIEYYAAPNATYTDNVVYVQSYWSDFCQNQTTDGNNFFENWWCTDTQPSYTDYFPDGMWAIKFSDDDCTTASDYWEVFNPSCVNDVRNGKSWAWKCSKDSDDSQMQLYSCDNTATDCMGWCTTYSYDGTIYSWYSWTDYCYDDYYSYNSYFQLYCGAETGYQVVDEYASTSNTAGNLVARYYYEVEECNTRGNLGWSYYYNDVMENWWCSQTVDAYSAWSNAMVLYYYSESTCTDFTEELSVPRSCVNHHDKALSYNYACSQTDSTWTLTEYKYDGADCTDNSPTPKTVAYSAIKYSDSCWSSSVGYSDFNCHPPNPSWQMVYYMFSTTNDMDQLYMYTIKWSNFCYEDGYYSSGVYMNYTCVNQTAMPDPYSIWDNAIVANIYSSSGCSSDNFVQTAVYMPFDACLADSTSTYSYSFDCQFNAQTTSSLTLKLYTGTSCSGTASTSYILSAESYGGAPYCYYDYPTYYQLTCVAPNPKWQIAISYIDVAKTQPVTANTWLDPYCYTYEDSITLSILTTQWLCVDDQPEWSPTYFTSNPMTANLYTTLDCSGDVSMVMAATVDCAEMTGFAAWGYCDPAAQTITGWGCPTTSYFSGCVDKDPQPSIYYGCNNFNLIDPWGQPTGAPDGCYYSEDYYPMTYTMECGDYVNNGVYWAMVEVPSEGECDLVSPTYADAYFTRFCGADAAGTCTLGTMADGITPYYLNETCVAQQDVEWFGKGEIIMLEFSDSDCTPEYQNGAKFLHYGCESNAAGTEYWDATCSHSTAEVTLSWGCPATCGSTCTYYQTAWTEGTCGTALTGGGSWSFICGAAETAVMAVLVAVMTLFAIF